MNERYLVYRMSNGKITAEIQFGQHHTGEGIKKDHYELKRIELPENSVLTLSQAMKEFPYE